MLIILGCLGAATASAGFSVPNCKPVSVGAYVGHGSQSCDPEGTLDNVYFQLVAWRFSERTRSGPPLLTLLGELTLDIRAVLGLGVGGEYPLASTITRCAMGVPPPPMCCVTLRRPPLLCSAARARHERREGVLC